ncbi:MAG: hypothetical protein JWM47_2202 [Acidimicrobiales bacterium]|nr:hypothetical protein [Acidimicrobiales bacterium]
MQSSWRCCSPEISLPTDPTKTANNKTPTMAQIMMMAVAGDFGLGEGEAVKPTGYGPGSGTVEGAGSGGALACPSVAPQVVQKVAPAGTR